MSGMIKRLVTVSIVTASFAVGALAPASASCGLAGLLSPCPPAPPVTPPGAVVPPATAPGAPAPVPPTVAPTQSGPPRSLVGNGIAEAPGAAALLLELVNRERAVARLGSLESRVAIVSFASGQSRAMAGR